MIDISAFGAENCIQNRENETAKVYVFSDAEESAFASWCKRFEDAGYAKKEDFARDAHTYAAFSDGTDAIFMNFYNEIGELYIVTEENCNYFSYTDSVLPAIAKPQITQVHLEDFGMSYVVRLSDGRFIVFDGGRAFVPDSDSLYACLCAGTKGEKPVIAAWILTHPHSDHYYCFHLFADTYKEHVIIEKVILNFPAADDLEHYPHFLWVDKRIEGFKDSAEMIPLMFKCIREIGATVYMAHTGQTYQIGDAKCEILASLDDAMHTATNVKNNINPTSLVVRMELGGQVILWAADASFELEQIPEKHGSYLKADILQVPHHGFGSGSAEAEIRGYNLIRPDVCFLPVSDYNAYTTICAVKESAAYLMRNLDVQEMITGDSHRTITLPYTAPSSAQKELEQKYLEGRDNCGARTWVFSNLFTGNTEDFEFTLLNMAKRDADISIDLFFEDATRNIRYIKVVQKALAFQTINIVSADVDDDAVYFNWMSLKSRGIPENVPFAVRFMSDTQIVVSHKKHPPSYVSTNR